MKNKLQVLSLLLCLSSGSLIAEVPSSVTTYLDNESNVVQESGMLPKRTAEGEAFVHGVVDNWNEILDNLATVAPTARQQALIAVGAEFLPPADYVSFINKVCDLGQEGGVKKEFISAILLARMIKGGYLAYNYDVPQVAAAINKLEAAVSSYSIPDLDEFITSIESGDAKTTIVAERQRYNDVLPENYGDPGVLAGQ